MDENFVFDQDASAEDFFAAAGVDVADLPDPSAVVTIRTSTGQAVAVPVSEPTPVSDLMVAGGLAQLGQVLYYVNGVAVPATELVAPGQTMTVVGNVKGG